MRKISPKLIIGILLTIFIGISLYLRIYLPYKDIFVNDWIKFGSNDGYFYMRIVDNLAHNFPHLNSFDPYLIYPGGSGIGSILFFAWLIAGVTWVIGLGSPTQHLIDVVGVYFPAILAALTIIPVYFIGKQLFSRWAGVLAAALIAIMPGEFLGRSLLGYTDHHIAETLFTTVAMLFLILAVKSAGQRQLTFSHLINRDWTASRRTLVYALLAGISLGIYLITWMGGLLFVFIITVYFIVQFIIDHLRRKSTDYLAIIGVVLFLVALIMVAPVSAGTLNRISILIALLVPAALSGISHLMTTRQLKPSYYPLALIGVGAVGLTVFYAVSPSLVGSMLWQFAMFSPSGPSLTTLEMQHLSIPLAWGNFTTGFFFSIIVWLILVYLIIRQGSAEKSLIVVWSLVIFAANIAQRRFAYYFAVNVALLVGYLSWQTIWLSGLNKLVSERANASEKPKDKHAKSKHKRRASPHITVSHINTALAVIIIFFFVFFWNITPALATARQARFAPTDAWYSALTWLKDNSPDPFGNPDFYYQLYQPPKPGQRYSYPKSAYGVTAWWDYGYWITRIAHRLPSTNPSQEPQPIISVTRLFLAQDESSARETMQKLDSRYIIIDNSTVTTKFWAVITWAAKAQSDFFDNYYLPQQKVFVHLYFPEYYQSLSTRLYNFDGKAVTPQSTIVISWEGRQNPQGRDYKEITSAQAFDDYKAATAYKQSQKSGNYRIIGNNPFISPVPLEALNDYKLVYSSTNTVRQAEVAPVPEVKIFEYTVNRANPAQK